jgi:hypothetical protein
VTDEAHRTGRNYLSYLATPAQMFATIVKWLEDAGLVREEESHSAPICPPLRPLIAISWACLPRAKSIV